MGEEQEIFVKDLVDRVHRLMEKYLQLKASYDEQIGENDELKRRLSEQQVRIENLEKQYNTAKIATNVLAPIEDKEEARGQLNRIVREIDNCIALLNR